MRLCCETAVKRILRIICLAFGIVFLTIIVFPDDVYAMPSINDNNIFLKQDTGTSCNITSYANMVRRRLILDNNRYWDKVVHSTVRGCNQGQSNDNLSYSSTLRMSEYGINMSVSHIIVNSNKLATIKSYIDNHPEGVIVWVHGDGWAHGVLATRYSGDIIYCRDPVKSYTYDEMRLDQSDISKSWQANSTNQSTILSNSVEIWYISADNSEARPDDTTPPKITDAKITSLSSTGYKVSCTVTDNSGVNYVDFPTWTVNNGQDDIVWHRGLKSGNEYYFWVRPDMHNNEEGYYTSQIYAYDVNGNMSSVTLSPVYVDRTPPTITNIGFVNITDTGCRIIGDIWDNDKVTKASVNIYHNNLSLDSVDAVISNGQVYIDFDISKYGYEYGSYSFKFWIHDSCNNSASASTDSITFTLRTEVSVENVSMNFGDEWNLNIYLRIPDAMFKDDEAYYAIGGPDYYYDTDYTKNYADKYPKQRDGTYRVSIPIPAKDLKSPVDMIFCDREGNLIKIDGKDTYRLYAMDYLKTALNSSDPGMVKLAQAMILYGNCANVYLTGPSKEIDESELDSELDSFISDEEYISGVSKYERVFTGELPEGITYVGSSLNLKSVLNVFHYFAVDADHSISDYKFSSDDGMTYKADENDGVYYITTKTYKIPEVGKTNTFYVEGKDSEGNDTSYGIEYSPLSYVERAGSTNCDAKLKRLAKSLYYLKTCANQYFGDTE